MDALERSHFLHDLTGKVWLSQNAAFDAVIAWADRDEEGELAPTCGWRAARSERSITTAWIAVTVVDGLVAILFVKRRTAAAG